MAKKSFEESLNTLENIVSDLESGYLPLEKALKKFDEGMALSRQCSTMLDETEKKVSQIMETSEESLHESPFEVETDSDA